MLLKGVQVAGYYHTTRATGDIPLVESWQCPGASLQDSHVEILVHEDQVLSGAIDDEAPFSVVGERESPDIRRLGRQYTGHSLIDAIDQNLVDTVTAGHVYGDPMHSADRILEISTPASIERIATATAVTTTATAASGNQQ